MVTELFYHQQYLLLTNRQGPRRNVEYSLFLCKRRNVQRASGGRNTVSFGFQVGTSPVQHEREGADLVLVD